MFERDLTQSGEEFEAGAEAEESRELDEATHEPGSNLEHSGSVEQAEMIESTVKGLVDSSQPAEKLAGEHQEAGDISEGLIEKELPEYHKQKALGEKEDLAGVLEEDYGSLIPGKGELTDPYGKERTDTDPASKLGIDSGFGEEKGIDSSSEDPEGDPFGPRGEPSRGGVAADGPNVTSAEEAKVMELITSGASEEEIAAYEKELQEAALDEYQLVYTSDDDSQPPGDQTPDSEDPPKPKPTTESTSTDEGTGRDVSQPSAEEVERVLSQAGGDEISLRDPDSPSGDVADAEINPKYAERVEAVLERAQESKHATKKAGSEVVTDPPAPVGGSGEGGPKPEDQEIGRKKTGQ